jgi:hypothetical protein
MRNLFKEETQTKGVLEDAEDNISKTTGPKK